MPHSYSALWGPRRLLSGPLSPALRGLCPPPFSAVVVCRRPLSPPSPSTLALRLRLPPSSAVLGFPPPLSSARVRLHPPSSLSLSSAFVLRPRPLPSSPALILRPCPPSFSVLVRPRCPPLYALVLRPVHAPSSFALVLTCALVPGPRPSPRLPLLSPV
ncbi:uncharacterized protein TRAVEDRAFT_48090 [Trametes versicolor FP-101664 SS1]|uniref:uncharacterized protein n=1 Tax=Trametes versicolor (strain FP-101664) TaxID=717944 RepID=UPI00046230C7|nr:uncharacterized protein TRAVEDRAFT_48090 [Trametes versicolor FP-101664 SS1]EIW58956.1 hypothetical protein TRAVEDRAFT_48090 [Trametes versicolor FP-101664 SS1]